MMEINIGQSDLSNMLQKVIAVVPSKTTLPILGNLLFTAEKGTLRLTATDLEVFVTTELKTEVKKEGSVAIPAKRINDIVRALPDGKIKIKANETFKVSIATDVGEYKIAGESDDEYPTVPYLEDEQAIDIAGEVLSRLITNTAFAVSTDELRPALMGVFMKIADGKMIFVSTDGHRLAKLETKNISTKIDSMERIIPTKGLTQVLKNVTAENRILIGENNCLFDCGETKIYTRIIDERYPDYERVIPSTNEKKMEIVNEKLLSSLRRVSIFSNQMTHQVKISLTKNSLEISTQDVESGGEATEKIECEYDDTELVIGYNSNLVMDALKHVSTDNVLFFFSEPTSAGIVYPANQVEQEEFMMLVMPVRLN